MFKILSILFCISAYYPQIPILADGKANIIAEIKIDNEKPVSISEVVFSLDTKVPRAAFSSIELYYTGAMSSLTSKTKSQALVNCYKRIGGSQDVYRNPAYSMLIGSRASLPLCSSNIKIETQKILPAGTNYLYLSYSIDADKVKDLSEPILTSIHSVIVNGEKIELGANTRAQRLGLALRQSGDDGVYAYRIPGLVTTSKGTLVAVFDVRYSTSIDLQEDIDVAAMRSEDGGKTWQKMQTIIDMGEYGGLPQSQNGVGDPCVLVNDNTGEIFVVAAWTHGLGNQRAWGNVGKGLLPEETAQLMMVSSKDDGKTWSEPRNITAQVKDPSWTFTLQGPGRGITHSDGTLVFPLQYILNGKPKAAIMYSEDHGQTWRTHAYAKDDTTESQVAELSNGQLMLNMRDNARTGRAVSVTSDLGRTWERHPSSGQLREPVCMGSLLAVKAQDNYTGKHLLLFANPDNSKERKDISIKASLDDGRSWDYTLLLDEELCWGYSCLTMIDSETVGIIYESSKAQILFQAIALKDILH